MPLVSIVMPSYQQVSFLEEAVRSVLDQREVEVELLVMDPGSTDGSRELLLALQNDYGEHLRLCFEPDEGQSDAVNRGMSMARGNVLGWLNSDDRLRSGALRRAASLLDSDEPRWLYGKAGIIDTESRPTSSIITKYKNWRGRRFSPIKLLTENFIPQMSVFWNRTMWERAGLLDVDLHLDMDYDLWLRFATVSAAVVINADLADFRVHGDAKGSRQTEEQLRQAYNTARRHAAIFGFKGKMALVMHRLLGIRTRMCYVFLKPGSGGK
jgi:glycosyltransferase involved in cell wall biosynthesis